MTHQKLSTTLIALLFLLGGLPAPAAEEPVTFEKHVRPILKAYCLECHGAAEKPKGKLDLRLRRFILDGGRSGPALVSGDAGQSLIVKRLKAGEMPPGEKKVPADQIAIIERWIAAGAPTLRDEPKTLSPGIDITPDERAYWFFQPLRRPVPPQPAGNRVRTPIDAFVLDRLEKKGLSFNADTDRRTLLRRASFDLTGLPPTQEAIDRFIADPAEDAYERALDRLLMSSHYGEHWGRHWLDVAGYADSDGDGTTDTPRPHAWKYRDYVIRSLNADKPLDQFVIEQLAGDELAPPPWNNLEPRQIELLAATGFLRMAPDSTASGGGEAEAQQVVADTLKIVSSSLLGLTVGCAQCHDHRYDPIPHVDYYRLRAIFEPALNPAQWRRPNERRVSLYRDTDRATAAAIDAAAGKLDAELREKQEHHVRAAFDKELAKFPADQQDKLRAAFATAADKRNEEQKSLVALNPKLNITPGVLYQYDPAAAEELKKLQARVAAKRAEKPVEDFVAVLSETPGQIPTTKLFHRGDYRQPTIDVRPGDLTIAAPDGQRFEAPVKDARLPTSGRRLAFARHLTSGTHPLFGRVLANRLWLHHFGRGIVDTPGDFGVLGQRPSHPELLDWLATELPRQGWSLKRMHRLLMTSTVYRQATRQEPAKSAVDANNELYGRYSLRRLEAESLRDCILVAAGRLDGTPGGPPIAVVADTVGQNMPPDDRPRRSVYLQQRRTQPVAFLSTFDGPAGEINCDRRAASTAAPQALTLMNGEFVRKQAAHFANRVRAETAAEPTETAVLRQVARAWQIAYQRPARPEEVDVACRFLERQHRELRAAGRADADVAALTNLCQQLLASNEFLYVD